MAILGVAGLAIAAPADALPSMGSEAPAPADVSPQELVVPQEVEVEAPAENQQ